MGKVLFILCVMLDQICKKYFGKPACIIFTKIICSRFGIERRKGVTLEWLEPILKQKFEENGNKFLTLFM